MFFFCFFFYQGFLSWTLTTHRMAGEGRGPSYSTLPIPPAHKHSDIYLQLFMWDDYHIFLIATLVFTRLPLDGILPPSRITIWLIDDVILIFVCLHVELILGFVTAIWHEKPVDSNSHQLSIILVLQVNWLTNCATLVTPNTSKPTNQVC